MGKWSFCDINATSECNWLFAHGPCNVCDSWGCKDGFYRHYTWCESSLCLMSPYICWAMHAYSCTSWFSFLLSSIFFIHFFFSVFMLVLQYVWFSWISNVDLGYFVYVCYLVSFIKQIYISIVLYCSENWAYNGWS